tara:strand:- start:397 stop:2520 length:2124 start_codon:yes stop_codon:yes gene_type:complete
MNGLIYKEVYLDMTLKILLTSLSVFVISFSYGQCGTDQLDSLNLISHLKDGGTVETYFYGRNELIQNYRNIKNKKNSYIIPIVFHIIHENGLENISETQIQDQLRILNEDFQRNNIDTSDTDPYFKSRASGMNIEFKLAKRDPKGRCTIGITRHKSWLTDEYEYDAVKSIVSWDSKRYLNVWIVNSIHNPREQGTILGYSTLPWRSSHSLDGVVIRSDFCGSIGTANQKSKGRTLTHEVGHWLGLYHPFQGQTGVFFPNDACNSMNDFVDDTPPALEPNYGCTEANSCNTDNPDEKDNIHNFMDYTNENCQNMFTQGQVNRMLYYLNHENYRKQIHSEENNKFTGVENESTCILTSSYDIKGSSTIICEGNSIEFKNISKSKHPFLSDWTFYGGFPNKSYFDNPIIKYPSSGYFDIELISINALIKDTLYNTNEIIVFKNQELLKSPNIDSVNSPDDTLSYFMERDQFGWQYSNKYGSQDSSCLVALNDSSNKAYKQYSLITPPYDLTNIAVEETPHFYFDYAYNRPTYGKYEKLRIYASTNCGTTWEYISLLDNYSTFKSGDSRVGEYNWTPKSQEDWLFHKVSLSKFKYESDLIIRIDFLTNRGNSYFIDNLGVEGYFIDNLGISSKIIDDIKIQIYPNPSYSFIMINGIETNTIQRIRITNCVGQNIKHNRKEKKIDISDLPAGVYFLTLWTKDNFKMKKFIKN